MNWLGEASKRRCECRLSVRPALGASTRDLGPVWTKDGQRGRVRYAAAGPDSVMMALRDSGRPPEHPLEHPLKNCIFSSPTRPLLRLRPIEEVGFF